MTLPPSWTPPPSIGEYQLVRLIGRGGMGQIYLAEDTLLERPVAVKFVAMIRPDERARQRFHVEARAAARLSHPNVVAIHRVGEHDGRPYLVTEFVRGQTLAELARPVPWKQALRIGQGLARGLAAAHRKGVLHRDIKPANVMLTDDDQVKLLDFGLAKILVEPPQAVGEPSMQGRSTPRTDPPGVDPMVGTPLYMAPETLRGTEATRWSDIYATGAVLYELCTGMAPREKVPEHASFEEWLAAEPPSLLELVPDIEQRFAAVLMRCLAQQPADRFASADELCTTLDAIAVDRPHDDLPEGNPYRGLQPFEARHRAFFFGRDTDTLAVIEHLRGEPLLVIAGDSGVGKSSLCRAGVIPAIERGALEDGRAYRIVKLVPGLRPVAMLASTLSSILGGSEEALLELIRSDPKRLGRELRRWLERNTGVLVFVDQLDELFTLSPPEEAAIFGEALAWMGSVAAGMHVLGTIRGDFLARLANLPGLGEEVPRSLYLLRALSQEAMRAAIVEPARRKGVAFESAAVVDTLVASTSATSGGLPLLQFAMAELWDGRDQARQLIPTSALEAIGGVGGALARHADGVLASLPPLERQATRHILLQLVTLEGTRGRRTRAELEALAPNAGQALEALVRGRLLVASEEAGSTAYHVAHEALLQSWGTLREWLDVDAGTQRLRERIEAAASDWSRLDRAPETLWSERQLAEVQSLEPSDVSPLGGEFLRISRAVVRRSRQRRLVLALSVPLVIGFVLGAVWLKIRWDLQQVAEGYYTQAQVALSEGRRMKSEAAKWKEKSFERYRTLDISTEAAAAEGREEAERAWAEARDAFRRGDDAFFNASQLMELALLLGIDQPRLRGFLSDVLVERIELAEWFHHRELREMRSRLSLYDEGTRHRQFTARPTLSITTSPPGAQVELHQYHPDGGRLRPVSLGVLGPAPIPSREVGSGPGSYLLILSAPGRAPVRHPLVLEPGENAKLQLWLPPAEQVPEGFVYVPPGTFLAGSADPEELRVGLINAPPLHPARTGPYLIARTEVTFGEWIEFLNDLPPLERARRTPSGSNPQLEFELTRHGRDPWKLSFTLDSRPGAVFEGESIEIPQRTRRTQQNWLRLPVSAISLDDAKAYLSWLARTGRVPGARLCSEHEWERAARGADGRAYPHGNQLSADDANFDVTYERKGFGPDEVGAHPESVSPFGLFDTTGNVYEWTRSMMGSNEAVIRGGSWYYDAWSVLLANRTVVESKTREASTGLRVCAEAPLPPPGEALTP